MRKYHLYIVLTRTNTLLSRLIQSFTNCKYTHAAISLDKELEQMYSFGRKFPCNPIIGGFMPENINKGLYKLQKTLPGLIMELEVSEEQYEKVEKLLTHFISNKNSYKYNYRGLIHSLFRREVCYDNQFLCSEFVYYILNESGTVDLKIPRNLVRPQTFLSLKNKIIYEGNLKDLCAYVNAKPSRLKKKLPASLRAKAVETFTLAARSAYLYWLFVKY